MDNTTTNTNNEEEISRYEMLASFLKDDTLTDLTLKGSDGVEVRANRYLLAARSQVFKGMFFGKFQEASSSIVELGFQGSVLKAIVEYILTDKVEMLTEYKQQKHDSEAKPSISYDEIQLLVTLAAAATYFNLPKLGKLVGDSFGNILKAWPSLSFAGFQACRMAGPSVTADLVVTVKGHVHSNRAVKIAAADDVAMVGPEVMEEILKDPAMKATEFELFQLLAKWTEGGEDRQNTARSLSAHIRLERINPEHLSTDITSSGLVTSDQLLEAYKYQALALNKGPTIISGSFERTRQSTENPPPVINAVNANPFVYHRSSYADTLQGLPFITRNGPGAPFG